MNWKDIDQILEMDVGSQESDIPAGLRQYIEDYMRKEIRLRDLKAIGTPFDLAVEAAHELYIVCAEQDWEIPVYVVQIAERMFKET